MKYILIIVFTFLSLELEAQVKPIDSDGNGYYNLSSLDNLKWVSENDSSWSWNFELDNNIDASDTKTWNGGLGWSPIGNNNKSFKGIINGNGFSINKLYISHSSTHGESIGLIGIADHCQLLNLNLLDCVITGNYGPIGGLVGYNQGSKIINSHVNGKISGVSYVGGLVGTNSGLVEQSSSECTITGLGDVAGGIVGENYGTIDKSYSLSDVSSEYGDVVGGIAGENIGEITNSFAKGHVSGYSMIGGIVGNSDSGTLYRCFFKGSIESRAMYSGGLIGMASNTNITHCFAEVNKHEGKYTAGGLIGEFWDGFISKSYVKSTIEGYENIAGFISYLGTNTIITETYSASYITCSNNCSPFIAQKSSYNTVFSKCFWDSERSHGFSLGGTALPKKLLISKSFLKENGWDTDSTWFIDSNINEGYPYLKLEPAEIVTDDYDFGVINLNKTDSLKINLTIYNQSSETELIITGYSELPDSIYSTSLPKLDSSKNLIIDPQHYYKYTIIFLPKEVREYNDSIIFFSNANYSDNVARLSGEVIDTVEIGVENIQMEEGIIFYPNPAKDYIMIDFGKYNGASPIASDIKIYNIYGSTVTCYGVGNTSNYKIDISQLPAGMYFVRINGKVLSFVKE